MKKVYVVGHHCNATAIAALEAMARQTVGNISCAFISESEGRGKGKNKGINRKYPIIKKLSK